MGGNNNNTRVGPTMGFNNQPNIAEMFIPTMETVRNTHWRHLLTSNGHNIACLGPSGIGKTVNILNLLQGDKLDKAKFQHFGISFSGQTMAAHVQDTLEAKLVKMRRGVYATTRSGSINCIFFVENVHMAKPDAFGTRSALELMR